MAKNTLNQTDIDKLRKVRENDGKQPETFVDPYKVHTVPQRTIQYDTFIPIDGLPSRGLFYKNELKGQPLKVEDLLLIESINDKNFHKVFNEIFSRRIIGIESHEILVCDEVYLGLWLRANSYPGYPFPHDSFICENPECETPIPENMIEFGFNDMDFNDDNIKTIYDQFGHDGCAEMQLKSGKKFTLYLRKRMHNARIQFALHRDFYAIGLTPPDELIKLLDIAVVVKFPDIKDIMETVAQIKTLTPMEFAELKTKVNKFRINGDPTITLKCPVCKEPIQFNGYTFRNDIFIPYVE